MARFAVEAAAERPRQINLNGSMDVRPAGHGDGVQAVELVTEFLLFLPGEELGHTQGGLPDRAHGGHPSILGRDPTGRSQQAPG